MRLHLVKHKAFLANVNARAERHGDELKPAGDLKFKIEVANQELVQLHPTLRSALYFHDSARPQDLVDQANEENPEYLPHLRFQNLVVPLKWNDDMEGGELTIHCGIDQQSWMLFPDIRVTDLQLTPKEGGTVEMQFSVQAHPDREAFGRLCDGMIQTQVEITLKPPEADKGLV